MKNKLNLLLLLLIIFNCKNQQNDTSKKNSVPASIDSHNSQNSLDYWGKYMGTIPCGDCEGIKISLTLNKDQTYKRSIQYIGKEDSVTINEGKFSWSKDGKNIVIVFNDKEKQIYKIGENMILHLDKLGNIIEGALSENYKLTKE